MMLKPLMMTSLTLGLLLGSFGVTGSALADENASKTEAKVEAQAPVAGEKVMAKDAALEEAVNRLQKAYEGLTSLEAGIQQTSRLSTLAKEEVQTGTIVMAKPGKIRWTFTNPYERLFVSDGTTLYIYNKDENQVIEQPLSGQSGVGVDFLLGLGDVRKDFDVSLAKEAEYMKKGRDSLGLKPKAPAGNISRMIFSVDQATGLVQEAWTFDAMDNRTHLVFSDLKVNPEVKAEIFTFTIPEGAEVIKAGGF